MAHDLITDDYVLREDAFVSYRRQQITFESDSELWGLEPSDQVSGVFPFDDPAYVISAWHPNGFPASWDQNMRYSAELAARIADEHGSVTDAVAHAPERTWFERALVVSGIGRLAVLNLAAEFGAPAYVEWTPDELRVHPISKKIESSTSSWSLTNVRRLCALKPDAQVDERCQRRGGPWVGASIKAALASQLEHAHAYALLGCDTCQGEQETKTPGRPIGLTTVSPTSRWCGLTALGRTTEAIILTEDRW